MGVPACLIAWKKCYRCGLCSGLLSRSRSGLVARAVAGSTLRSGSTALRTAMTTAAGTLRAAMPVATALRATHAALTTALGTLLLELSLGGSLLGIIQLTVLVGVKLLQHLLLESGLHLRALGLKISLHSSLLGVIELTVLVGIKLLHELGTALSLLLRAHVTMTAGSTAAVTLRAAMTALRAKLAALAAALSAHFLELCLGSSLLGIIQLTVLVGIELLQHLLLESGLHLRALSLKISLGSCLLSIVQLTILVGIKLLQHHLVEVRALAGLTAAGFGRSAGHSLAAGLLGGALLRGSILSHHRQSGEQSKKEGFLHIVFSVCC